MSAAVSSTATSVTWLRPFICNRMYQAEYCALHQLNCYGILLLLLDYAEDNGGIVFGSKRMTLHTTDSGSTQHIRNFAFGI